MSTDPNCGVAHGDPAAPVTDRVLVAVFASPVAAALLRLGVECGYAPVLVEPGDREVEGLPVGTTRLAAVPDEPHADVVVCDHHRPELGEVLRDALATSTRWIGLMGNPRHEGPHVAALAALGVPADEVARVHRPIGLDIGSRAPGEIAVSTLAGLLADRNGRGGGPFGS
ncbi:XdhC Rossmann domain-containing protein [Klenkia soli]|uniref:XdhC Rossmann domain-containing protein n=1 Tax=Klenkia soli TaxID=1052260 RepID=A0A1H0HH03_9ACTN|nr:XdhC family protein [Klenkia soli]SDO18442.1 XdhC Rossmann domain-containing protein [Klenkia soli]